MLRDQLQAFYDAVVGGGPPGDRFSGRLAVYQEAYTSRLIDVLAEQHASLRAVVGPAAFARLARRYLAAYPPTEPDIGDAGDALPQFLSACEPWLAELAALERLHVRLFDAVDAAPLTAADLTGHPAAALPGLPLAAVPACALLVAEHDVAALWESPTSTPARALTRLVVWRKQGSIWHRKLDATEHRALTWLQRGGTLAELAASLAGDIDDAARLLWSLLGRWVEDEILARPA